MFQNSSNVLCYLSKCGQLFGWKPDERFGRRLGGMELGRTYGSKKYEIRLPETKPKVAMEPIQVRCKFSWIHTSSKINHPLWFVKALQFPQFIFFSCAEKELDENDQERTNTYACG